MPANGKVVGKLVAQLDLQTAGFMKSTTGVNKAIRQIRSNLKTLDKFYKASGDEMNRLNSKYKQSKILMETYKEKLNGLKKELSSLKPNTQAFIKQQSQIRRTEADMKQLEAEMKNYRKQMLYVNSSIDQANAKYKSHKAVLEANRKIAVAQGNAEKKLRYDKKLMAAQIQRNNEVLKGERVILGRIRSTLGITSNEYKEQAAKVKQLKAENVGLTASMKSVNRQMLAYRASQKNMNAGLNRSLNFMKQNKAGLIDVRNSLMGLTAAATGVAYPIARAFGGAIKATVQWEDAQANVAKTTNASKEQMKDYSDSIRSMAKQMPESQAEIANTMAMAAQLGVKNLKGFTKVATQMSVATDMTAEDAATSMARFANATGKPNSDFKKLGSTVVQLGNNMATQESTLMNFAQRLAGTATVVGVSQKDIMALSAAMASVGINAESGGSAMSKVLTKMNNAVKDGGEKLQGFAKVAGMSGQEFAEVWKKDPYQAVQQFEKGLADQNKQGKNVKAMLKDLGITELRETDTVLRLANGHEQLDNARKNANKGYKEGNALSKEAETKYKTLGNQMKIFMNHVRDLGISLGSALAPALIGIMKVLTPLVDALAKAPTPIKAFVAALALIPVIAVPVLGVAAAITGAMGLVGQSMLVAEKAAMSSSRGLRFFVATQKLMFSPIKTTTQMLQNLAASFGRTGKASKVMAAETVASEKAVEASSVGMSRVARNSNTASKSMQGAGVAMASTGKKASFTSKLFGGLKKVIGPLIGMGGLLTAAFEALAAVIGALSAPILAIVAAVAAVGVAFVVAYKKVKWFRDGINGLVYVLKVFAGGIVSSTVNGIKSLGRWFGWLGGIVKDKATSAIKSWWKSLPQDSDIKQQVKAVQSVGNSFKNVMKTLGTATHKATDVSNVLGKGVSKGTKQALNNFVDYSEKSDKILAEIKNNHGRITTEEKNKLLQIQQDTTKDLMSEFEKRAKGQLDIERKVFSQNSGLSEKQEQAILQRTEKRFSKSKQKLTEINKEIQELVNKQARDGKLSGKEMKRLNQLYDEQRKLAVGTLSSTDKEQKRILSRMSANREAYNVKEAQSIVKEAIKARDNAKKENKKRYDQEVDHINSMTDLSKTEKEKMLKDADDRYRKANKKADDNHKKVLDGVKKSNEDIETEMDLSNGKVYSNAEKWWEKTKKGFGNFFGDIGKSFSDMGKSWKKNWDEMISDISSVDWSGMWDGIKNTGSNIGGWFSEKGQEFAKSFKGGWDETVTRLGDLWSKLKGTGSNLGTWFAEKGRQWYTDFKDSWETTKQTAGDLWQGLKNTGTGLGQWFGKKGAQWYNSFKDSWETTKQTAGDLWAGIKNTGAGLGEWFGQKGAQWYNNFKGQWDLTKSTAGDLWNGIKSTSANLGQWFGQKGAQLWNSLKSGWTTAVTTTGNLWGTITGKMAAGWESVKGWFATKGAQMVSAIVQGWNSTVHIVGAAFGTLWGTVKRIWSGMTGTIRYWSGVIWARVKTVFGWIGNKIGGSLGAAWKRTQIIWKGIKGTFTYWTGVIWTRVKTVFNWIKGKIGSALMGAWKSAQRIWKGMKGTFTYWTGAIWNRVKSVFGWIKNRIGSTLNGTWKIVQRVWKGIKGTITYWTGAIWNRIKSIFGAIKNRISSVMNAVWKIMQRIWKGIKGTVTYWTGAILGRVKSIFGSMRNTISKIMNRIKSIMSNIWRSIKRNSIDLMTGMWNRIKSVFNNMVDGVKSFGSSVKKHIGDMVGGVKKGLNGLIKGVNWVGGKLGIDKKIPTLSTGTESTHTQNFVRNGAISTPTLATVNDKGPGNGTGRNGHQELIQRKNGSLFAPQGKDVVVPLNKGDKVINGKTTQKMRKQGLIPKFSRGTDEGDLVRRSMLKDAKKAKRKQKRKHNHNHGIDAGEMMGQGGMGGAAKEAWKYVEDKTKNIGKKTGKTVSSLSNGAQKMLNTSKEALGAAGDWAKKKAGDLMDYVGHPGKLLQKVMSEFGADFSMVKGEIPSMLWDAMWKRLKEAVESLFNDWLDDAMEGDGDGKYIKYLDNITTPYSPNGPPPGYAFNWAHPGIDLPYIYEKVQTPLEGKVQTKDTGNVGFGHHVVVKAKPYDAYFGHMSKWSVKNGQHVKPGDVLGISGNTGSSTGPHLHYEMNKHGMGSMTGHSIDPVKWLKSHNGSKGGRGGVNKSASAWASDIRRAAKQMHTSVSSGDVSRIVSLIQHESGGNAGVTQSSGLRDINVLQGNPAKGLLQFIPQTFRHYAVRGHRNIMSGYDQLLAFFNNKYWRSQFNPGGGWSPSGPRRYANGGMIKKHGLYEAGEGNRPEMVLPLTKKNRSMQLIEQAKSFMGIKDEPVSVDSGNGAIDIIAKLLEQNNRLLETIVNVVDNKELVVDGQAITNSVSQNLGSKYNQSSYHRGKKHKR
ncbi:tail length tape-measure protein [Staphylococcus phage vB_SepS_SEP9]|uniref:Tail length tape-measure protein n=1 Tax=Staphylococcus phage vB_SepS_SEP9 TaxID=1434319 RepID=W5RV88_9CAUD|nr:tail length tape measure protein [Staphylococcus phage vB_SepS_SEP9]AHG23937.1 tail length tape-measure protein [Staphylococcus phage vB_SepS_SEP9]